MTVHRYLVSNLASLLLLAAVCAPLPGLACRSADPELEAMVERLLPRLEERSGLEAIKPLRVARRGEADLRAYLVQRLESELPDEEVAGIEATYRALGLLPGTIDLRSLLLDLYGEQVVGHYDPETETLYVMEGVPAEALETVVVHELVHALQDQHTDIDSLIARRRGNDRQLAAHAALEGHATLVMFEMLLEEQVGRPLDASELPDLRTYVRPLLEAGHAQYPVFQGAPPIIRESLLFPYVDGAAFVQRLWREDRRPPLGELLPRSTAQVLWPEEHFIPEPLHPLEVEFRAPPAPGWRVLRENTIGAFEVRLLLNEHLGNGRGEVARGWRGDGYRMLERQDGARALIWVSIWADEGVAASFASAYEEVAAARADRRVAVDRVELDGRPAVVVVDADSRLDPRAVPAGEPLVREGMIR